MADLRPDLSDLLRVLSREQDLLDALSQLIDRERDVIKTLAKDEFSAVNTARQQILHDLAEQEQERASAVTRLAAVWGVDPDEITVHMLLDRAGPVHAQELRQYQARLTSTTLKVREGLDGNQAMISRFLGALHDIFAGWRHAGNVPTGYSSTGALSPLIGGGALFEQKG